jgi:acyl carrier protein
MQTDALEQRIRTFMEEELLVTFDDTVTADTDLFKAGVVESRDYLRIIRFLQEDLGVAMTDEDLFMNVLVSLSGIVDFIRKKQAGV